MIPEIKPARPPETGYLRLSQIVGHPGDPKAKPPKPAIPAMIPIAPSTWWMWVKKGKAPKPVKIERCTFWRESDIRKMMEAGA